MNASYEWRFNVRVVTGSAAETLAITWPRAAAISPRTFFRYFPSKEDVVMWDEYDLSRSSSGKHSRRTSHSAVSFRAVIRESLAGLLRNDPSSWDRIRLFATVPELHARFLDEQTRSIEQVARLLKTKRGRRVDDLILQVVGSALLAAVAVALERWQKDEGKSDLLALLDQATNALAEGIRELRRSEASPPAGAARARPSRPTRDRRSPERKRGA